MIAVRFVQWLGALAGLGALILGLVFWIAQVDVVNVHMLFGLTVALSLLLLSFVAVFTRGMRLLGAVGVVYAVIVPVFGLRQATLLVGDMHWLIQTAHLLVGLGALALIGIISTRYMRLKKASARVAVPEAAR